MPAVDAESLREAIRRVQQGDESAREGLAELLQTVAHHAASALKAVDEEEREELTQVALVAMWLHVGKVDLARNPYAFMRRVGFMAGLGIMGKERARQVREMSLDQELERDGAEQRAWSLVTPTRYEKPKP